MIHNFNDDGFDSLVPEVRGWPAADVHAARSARQIKKIALSRPQDHDLPFSTWSLSKLAEFLVAEGVVDDISHEGLRVLLREEGVSFQVIKTFKQSNDPDFEAKKNRVLELYAIADGKAAPGPGDPTVVFCMDEFGPLNLQPHPGKQWAPVAAKAQGDHRAPRRRRRRATYNRPHGVRHLMAALRPEPGPALRPRQDRTRTAPTFLAFCRYLRSAAPARGAHRDRAGQLQPAPVDQEGPPRRRVGGSEQRRARLRADLRVVAEPDRGPVPALRYFALDGTDHADHDEQDSMIRRYIAWRNRNAHDKALRELVNRANVA